MKESKVAIYASDLFNNTDTTVDEQIEQIVAKCKEEGKAIAKIYIDKSTNKTTPRQLELMTLIGDSGINVFNEVIVWKTNILQEIFSSYVR